MKRFFALMVLAIFIVSGCEMAKDLPSKIGLGNDNGLDMQKQIGQGGDITMTIDYPGDDGQVVSGISFTPLIRIVNGGSSSARGQVCITGLYEDIFAGSTSCDCLTYGFTKLPDESFEPEILEFGPYQVNLDPQDLRRDFTMTAINRYEFTSTALFNPCIRKERDVSDCKVSMSNSANGPVSITGITEVTSPQGKNNVALAFKVGLKKTGSGDLILIEDVANECAMQQQGYDKRKVKPKVYGQIEGLPFRGTVNCRPAELGKDGTATMTCVVGEVNMFDQYGNYIFSSSSETPAKLTVGYAFETRDSSKFKITDMAFA